MAAIVEHGAADPGQVMYAIVPVETGRAAGFCSLMRIDPAMGSIEVGGIAFGRQLQRSRAATEAMALLMRHVFDDLGFRRYEWKCDSLNAPVTACRAAGSASSGRAGSATRWSTRAATATPTGSRSPTSSGRACARPSTRGSTTPTSTTPDASAPGSRLGRPQPDRTRPGGS